MTIAHIHHVFGQDNVARKVLQKREKLFWIDPRFSVFWCEYKIIKVMRFHFMYVPYTTQHRSAQVNIQSTELIMCIQELFHVE